MHLISNKKVLKKKHLFKYYLYLCHTAYEFQHHAVTLVLINIIKNFAK